MVSITRWDPMRDVMSVSERMARLFDEAGRMGVRRTPEEGYAGVWAPAVDVRETKDTLVLAVELPGMDPKDVEVSVENNVLAIRGERSFEKAEEGEMYHRVERAYGSFERTFQLPSTFAADKIEARAANGVLTLTIPKREEAKPRSIKVAIDSK